MARPRFALMNPRGAASGERPRFALRNPSPREIQQLLSHVYQMAVRRRQYMPILMWGETGVGKSESAAAAARRLGIGFVDLRLGQQEVGDLIGFPREEEVYPCYRCMDDDDVSQKDKDKQRTKRDLQHHLRDAHRDAGVGTLSQAIAEAHDRFPYQVDIRMVHTTPDWWPPEGTSGILFLDELNRGTKAVLQAIFQLVLERRLHTHVLPDGWIIVAAVNPLDVEGGGYSVLDLTDKAFLARFLHVTFDPDPAQWHEWAKEHDVHPDVRAFLRSPSGRDHLSMGKKPDLPPLEPTPRSWAKFGSVLEDLPKELEDTVARGMLGSTVLPIWKDWRSQGTQPIDALDLLENYPKHKETVMAWTEEGRDDVVDKTFAGVERLLREDQRLQRDARATGAFVEFLMDIPRDKTRIFLETELNAEKEPFLRPIFTPHLSKLIAWVKSANELAERAKAMGQVQAAANPRRPRGQRKPRRGR